MDLVISRIYKIIWLFCLVTANAFFHAPINVNAVERFCIIKIQWCLYTLTQKKKKNTNSELRSYVYCRRKQIFASHLKRLLVQFVAWSTRCNSREKKITFPCDLSVFEFWRVLWFLFLFRSNRQNVHICDNQKSPSQTLRLRELIIYHWELAFVVGRLFCYCRQQVKIDIIPILPHFIL